MDFQAEVVDSLISLFKGGSDIGASFRILLDRIEVLEARLSELSNYLNRVFKMTAREFAQKNDLPTDTNLSKLGKIARKIDGSDYETTSHFFFGKVGICTYDTWSLAYRMLVTENVASVRCLRDLSLAKKAYAENLKGIENGMLSTPS